VRISVRLALLFTVATVVLLIGAGLLYLHSLRSGLEDSLDSGLRSRADEVINQFGSDPAPEAAATSGKVHLASGNYGQVLTGTGTVLESTDDAIQGPLLTPAQARAAERSATIGNSYVTPRTAAGAGHPVRVRLLAERLGRGGLVVAVATSREVADEALERAARQLLILGVVVLLLAGPGAWLIARAALRPVDRMRRQAAALQDSNSGGGLFVPRTNDEIARLGETLNRMLAGLQASLERERAFVADAGHELRTPLTVLRGELELAQRPGRTREQLAETVAIAAAETDRLSMLAEDLLFLARESSGMPVRLQSVRLTDVVASAVQSMRAQAEHRGVLLETKMPPVAVIDGDPARLRQALDNLLSNAVRYCPPGGTIVISGNVHDGMACLTVTDDGPGFPAEFLPVAFGRFRRADAARARSTDSQADAGTGLGLAIVAAIMRAHGGTATAHNRDDRSGAVVVLTWPVSAG
jgi:signal transduction histidine kinase